MLLVGHEPCPFILHVSFLLNRASSMTSHPSTERDDYQTSALCWLQRSTNCLSNLFLSSSPYGRRDVGVGGSKRRHTGQRVHTFAFCRPSCNLPATNESHAFDCRTTLHRSSRASPIGQKERLGSERDPLTHVSSEQEG